MKPEPQVPAPDETYLDITGKESAVQPSGNDAQEDNLRSMIHAIHTAAVPLATPPPGLEEELLKRIASASAGNTTMSPGIEGISILRHQDIDWIPLAVEKGRACIGVLTEEKGHAIHTILVRCDPDTVFPEHKHLAFEHCYVVHGDFHTEGQVLQQGDFLRFGEHVHHGASYSEGGCLLVIVAPLGPFHRRQGYKL